MRTRDASPYGEDWWPGGNVGADAYIGPNPPQAGLFGESHQAARARRATISRPYGTSPSWQSHDTSPKALRALGEA